MSDATSLREFLPQPGWGGTDYGLTDAELAIYAAAAKALVQGRRLSWHVLAQEAIKADQERKQQ